MSTRFPMRSLANQRYSILPESGGITKLSSVEEPICSGRLSKSSSISLEKLSVEEGILLNHRVSFVTHDDQELSKENDPLVPQNSTTILKPRKSIVPYVRVRHNSDFPLYIKSAGDTACHSAIQFQDASAAVCDEPME